MYKITILELRYPVGSEDNKADDYGTREHLDEEEVAQEVRQLLPTLGSTYSRWLEIECE